MKCVGTLTKCPHTAGVRSRRGSPKAGTTVIGSNNERRKNVAGTEFYVHLWLYLAHQVRIQVLAVLRKALPHGVVKKHIRSNGGVEASRMEDMHDRIDPWWSFP